MINRPPPLLNGTAVTVTTHRSLDFRYALVPESLSMATKVPLLRRWSYARLAIPLAFALTAKPADINQLSKQEKRDGFILLFDGKTLNGWKGDPEAWSVKEGSIIGSSDQHKIQQNTFLIYREPQDDFILRVQTRLRNGNSGVQFRSRQLPGPGWIVSGYQADISDAGDRSAWGNFYEERGRSRTMMKTPDEGWLKGKAVVKAQDWNEYEILADGSRIRLTLNGLVTIDTVEDKWATGIIALQLHSGEPMQVEFRNIRMKKLQSSGSKK